ncbi:unknown [synthetic Vaccinia virus]|nr:unknown [synthetic Vaccinia virus]
MMFIHCVVFPDLSNPSKTINAPRDIFVNLTYFLQFMRIIKLKINIWSSETIRSTFIDHG